MGEKSRENWRIGMCFKNCKHQNTDVCKECLRFIKFELNEENNERIIGTKSGIDK